MRLIYLLEKNSHNNAIKEFTFHNLAQIRYDQTEHSISITDVNEDIQEIEHYLWNENDNISGLSAIVGDNGSGKTTLLKRIADFLNYEKHPSIAQELIGVFYDKKKKCFYCYSTPTVQNDEQKLRINVSSPSYTGRRLSRDKFENIYSEKSIIYLTNSLNKLDFEQPSYTPVFNASLGALVRKSNDSIREGIERHPLVRHFEEETLRQLQLVYPTNKLNEPFPVPFPMPTSLFVELIRQNDFKETLVHKLKSIAPSNEKKSDELKAIFEMVNNSIANPEPNTGHIGLRFYYDLSARIVLNFLFEVISDNKSFHTINSDERFVLLNISDGIQRQRTLEMNPSQWIHSIIQTLSKSQLFYDLALDDIKKIGDRYIKSLEYMKRFLGIEELHEEKNKNDSKIILVNDDTYEIHLSAYSEDALSKFVMHYTETASSRYLTFSWGLSTGENNFLNLFSLLWEASLEQNSFPKRHAWDEQKNICVLIDEAEISFHPRWQVDYIHSLTRFASKIFKDGNITFILATHSPILLSDVPDYNVVYLKKNNNVSHERNERTFGQNIYNLFKDSFFLDQVQGQVQGNFSMTIFKRIEAQLIEAETNQISQHLFNGISDSKYALDHGERNSKVSLEILNTIITIVGEDILRNAYGQRIGRIRRSLQSPNVRKSYDLFSNMSNDERQEFIKLILKSTERDVD
ncbi:AAA family ATPase [Exiguobacterium sp. KJ 601]|uniref:AAA family ATPase n=1 Tax=Exiguobacterium sp. KJ 601 TaxID=2782569 RepID=UPI0022AF1077|nr:AAA family ATPase [Exiguobacterium sp. KJ 601]